MDKNILDFGAIGDGQTLCTVAIQEAIDACAASGGGRVTIPAGTYISGTIWLKSHVELHIGHGAVLKASTNMNDYNEIDAYEQNYSSPVNEQWLGKHLIIALECEDVALTGNGIIDGSAEHFFGEPIPIYNFHWRYGQAMAKDLDILRPGQLICFIECRHVRVENVTLQDMPCWGCFVHGCDIVNIRGIRVYNKPYYANTDGIDIDCCSHVTISDCIIDSGDDAIAIRGDYSKLKQKEKPCEFITISNCVLGAYANGIRFGVGDGIIRHVRISNITMLHAGTAFHFLTDYLGNGHIDMEDIHISGVSAVEVARPLIISEGNQAYIRNITLENYYVEAYAGGFIRGTHEGMLSNISLRNVTLKLVECPVEMNESLRAVRGDYFLYVNNVSNLNMENVSLEAEPELVSDWEGLLGMDSCRDKYMRHVTSPYEQY